MTVVLAVLLAIISPTHLTLVPWHGADLPTATKAAAKYRLDVTGIPRAQVHLRASGFAPGWIAAFCTARVCSPFQTMLDLDARGRSVVQFELIRDDDSAPHRSGTVLIRSDDGARITVRSVRQ